MNERTKSRQFVKEIWNLILFTDGVTRWARSCDDDVDDNNNIDNTYVPTMWMSPPVIVISNWFLNSFESL